MVTIVYCNASEDKTTDIWSTQTVVVLGTVQVLANSVSLVLNCAVIIILIRGRQYQRPIFILFYSLGFSDLLTSFSSLYVSMLFMMKPDSTIYGSEQLLKGYSAFSVAILSSLYNLMSIGIERYLSVTDYVTTRHKVTKWQSLLAATVNWALAILLGCLPLVGWDCLEYGDTSNLYSPLCMSYLIFVTIPNAIATFVILIGTYVTIIVKLRKHKTAITPYGGAIVHNHKQAEMRVTRTSVLIWVFAMVSYLPFLAGVVWDATNSLCPQEVTTNIFVFRNVASIMLAVNSIGNPVLYTLKCKSLGNTINSLKCTPAPPTEQSNSPVSTADSASAGCSKTAFRDCIQDSAVTETT